MADFLVDTILPTQEVHLIGGPSGSGKSTWLLQFIESWRAGKPLLGYPSHPEPFVYLSADRSDRSVRRIFERLKLTPEDFRFETAMSISSQSLILVLNELRRRHPDTTVFFIEGFQSFTPQHKMNDYGIVANFLTTLLRYCTEHKITIFGVCHATKTKKDEGYENPRQRLNGSVAWAAYSETIIFIEPANPSDPNDSSRRVMVLPRNAAEKSYLMEFKNGRLIEKTKALTAAQRLEAWVTLASCEQDYRTEEILVATLIPRSTLAVELSAAVQKRWLILVKQGLYRKPSSTTQADA